MKKVRAAVVVERGAPIRVEEVDLEDPREGEVRVKLVASGVCHSCLHAAAGSWTHMPGPIALGDEGAGIVEAAGPGGRGVPEGGPVPLSRAPTRGLRPIRTHGR